MISETHPAIRQAKARGLIPPTPTPDLEAKPARIRVTFAPPGTWTLGVETRAEVNGRDWRSRSSRTQAARRAVSAAFGRAMVWVAAFADHYHRGGRLRVVLTRLGGKRLDPSNLPTALKAVEDAVALMLGADDGDARWVAEWHQEPGGAAVGVRVELACGEPPGSTGR